MLITSKKIYEWEGLSQIYIEHNRFYLPNILCSIVYYTLSILMLLLDFGNSSDLITWAWRVNRCQPLLTLVLGSHSGTLSTTCGNQQWPRSSVSRSRSPPTLTGGPRGHMTNMWSHDLHVVT